MLPLQTPSKLNVVFSLISLVLIGLYLLGWGIPPTFELPFLVMVIFITGIPHGAIDHIVYKNTLVQSGTKYNMVRHFFLPYLSLLALTALAWLIVPAAMFWVFMLCSAYHFGQSQLYYIKWPEQAILKKILYLSWGITILAQLLYHHWEHQTAIMQTLFDWDYMRGGSFHKATQWAVFISPIITFAILLYAWRQSTITLTSLLLEIGVFALLIFAMQLLPPFIAFAVYFGLWHSLRVMFTQYDFLNQNQSKGISLRKYIMSYLPFSILSIVGLLLLWVASQWMAEHIAPFMLFLLFISALTMPHAVVMHGMYNKFRNR